MKTSTSLPVQITYLTPLPMLNKAHLTTSNHYSSTLSLISATYDMFAKNFIICSPPKRTIQTIASQDFMESLKSTKILINIHPLDQLSHNTLPSYETRHFWLTTLCKLSPEDIPTTSLIPPYLYKNLKTLSSKKDQS